MSNHDYDLYELMSLSMTALSIREEAIMRITEFAGQYQRLAKIGRFSEYNYDLDILSKAWLTFTTKLFAIYEHANIWDERGCANFYFKRFLGNDMVLTAFPRIDPRNVPPCTLSSNSKS